MNDFLDQTKREVEKKVDQVTVKANEAREAIVERMGAAKDAAVERIEDGREYVRKNPEKSAGIALGIGAFFGAIVGFFTGRRK